MPISTGRAQGVGATERAPRIASPQLASGLGAGGLTALPLG